MRPVFGEVSDGAAEISAVGAFFGAAAEVEPEEAPRALPVCDRATLASIYATLAPRVSRFLRDLLGDAALAADATQETFVRAFRKVDDLPRTTPLVPWVFGIARFVAMEVRRARGRSRRVIDDGALEEARVRDPRGRSPEAELLDREAITVVERALSRLSEERRAALLLRCDHGLAYDEIAPLMGWSLAKVKVEIFRAREILRATLEEYRDARAAIEPGERAGRARAGGGS